MKGGVMAEATEAMRFGGEWEKRPLGELARIATGTRNNQDKQRDGKYPFFVRSSSVERIDSYAYDCAAILIPGEGRIGEIFHYVDGRFDVHQRVYAISDIVSSVSVRFLYYYMAKRFGRHALQNTVKATVDSLRLPTFLTFRIPLPSLPEQRAIAAVLSDVDELIASLEVLVAKKRAMKQAAMQELFTGRTRLPGFGREWLRVALAGVADIRNGGTPRTGVPAYWGGRLPWCVPTDITASRGKYLVTTARSITSEGLASCGASLLPAGSLLLCSRATIGEIKISSMPVATNQGFKSMVCTESVDNEFLYYRLVTLKERMIDLATGSTFLEISKRDLANICIDLPPLSEQRAIATILADMDSEITALEQRLDKTCAIKQGMMQQLLTRSIRLPIPADSIEEDANP